MCGIAGIVTRRPEERRETLLAMSAAIAHRGPDDSGTWTGAGVALAHRRLSILDRSSAGHQPMLSHDGRLVMVYNGEIYNYVELQHELAAAGIACTSHCDSEVLLEAFAAWGESCLAKLNGMWAFAIWDRVARRLFLARDRFGEKPFHYAIRDGELLFASEIKALLATGRVERSPEPSAIADFCAERVSDHTSQTFFRGISQLPPGTCGWWQGGALKLHRYWRLPPDEPAPPASDIVSEVRALLEDSVRLRLRSDVAVGTLLSGGLDSSGVTCIAARAANGHIAAFSTVDRDPPEEAAGIDQVRRAFPHIEFHRDQSGAERLGDELDACLWHQEAPFADASMLAHFRLMHLARQSGVRVLLTGQAADEVFAGYPGYLSIHLAGLMRSGRLGATWRFYRALRESGQSSGLASAVGYALPTAISARLRHRRAVRTLDWVSEEYRSVTAAVAHGYAGMAGDPVNAALRLSIAQRTLPGFLHYEDRNSMAFGVETRIPFLDHRLVARVLPLSGGIKLAGARTKSLLRQVLARHVPTPIVARLSKQGYPAPLAHWLRNVDQRTGDRWLALVEACRIIRFAEWRRRRERFMAGDDAQLPPVWRGLIVAMWYARFIAQET